MFCVAHDFDDVEYQRIKGLVVTYSNAKKKIKEEQLLSEENTKLIAAKIRYIS